MINGMSVREGQKRRRNIAKILSNNQKLSDLDDQFFINALKNISDGHDAGTELGFKA